MLLILPQLRCTAPQCVLDRFEYLPIRCTVATASQNLLRYREELASGLKAGKHALKTKVTNPSHFRKLSIVFMPCHQPTPRSLTPSLSEATVFSLDGVYGLALTLMYLNLDIPADQHTMPCVTLASAQHDLQMALTLNHHFTRQQYSECLLKRCC